MNILSSIEIDSKNNYNTSVFQKDQNKIMYGQQSGDQFQTHHDELLTYSFSTNVQSSPVTESLRPKKKVQEKLTLNIIQPLKTMKENETLVGEGKFKKRSMYTNEGKIIKIGEAVFKSNFQCGSMGEVTQAKGQNTYMIKMDRQVNSNRASAWFYFRCEGLKGEVNFIISGFTKTSSLYSEGMKVCYRQVKKEQPQQNSHSQAKRHKSQWQRGGSKISYTGNYDTQNQQSIFELKFAFNFIKNYDTHEYPIIEFAYCYPYEYKRVNLLARNLVKKGGVVFESLGKTYQGRDIPVLTIGNLNASKSIVLSARVHPGETVSSFIMEGLLKELMSDNEFATSLKEKYLFKIVPMINPDGVVRGNYRFSAAGYDLNRRWKHCYESSHPEVFYLKNMIKKLHKEKKVLMYIDIHGHSRKKSAFFYGCCGGKDLGDSWGQDDETTSMTKPKEFPFLMSKINPNFKYEYCTFNMSKDKEGTARIQMYKQLHIDHVYTLESSFCGSADGGHNFTEEDFMGMGKSLLEGISVYFYEKDSPRQTTMCESVDVKQMKTKNEKNSTFEKFMNILNEAKEELKNSPQLLNVGMAADSGSDSEPEAGIIPEEMRVIKSTTLGFNIAGQTRSGFRQKSEELNAKPKSPAFLKNSKSIKITVRQQNLKKTRLTPEELKNIVDEKLQNLKNHDQQKHKFQKEIISMTVNNFYSHNSQQLDSLTTEALMKKNERVHSKHVSNRSMLQKLKSQRLNSQNLISKDFDIEKDEMENDEEDEKRKLEIMTRNLLKTREGVQYRRVKKMAQQMKKKHQNSFTAPSFDQPPAPIVRGIITVNNELNLSKKRMKSIAPSFYPQSQQKNRRFSVEMAYKNNKNSFRSGKIPFELANKRLFINGDDINVHCKGTKIYL